MCIFGSKIDLGGTSAPKGPPLILCTPLKQNQGFRPWRPPRGRPNHFQNRLRNSTRISFDFVTKNVSKIAPKRHPKSTLDRKNRFQNRMQNSIRFLVVFLSNTGPKMEPKRVQNEAKWDTEMKPKSVKIGPGWPRGVLGVSWGGPGLPQGRPGHQKH